MPRGGKREGAGRKAGWYKPEGVRPQKQMRAYPEEWELIQRFAKLIKYGDKAACIEFLDSQQQPK